MKHSCKTGWRGNHTAWSCNLAELFFQLISDFKLYMLFELPFPALPLSVPLMPLIHAGNNSCSMSMLGLLGTKQIPKRVQRKSIHSSCASFPAPCHQSIQNLINQAAVLDVPGDFASVSSVQSMLLRGKLQRNEDINFLLSHWQVSCYC